MELERAAGADGGGVAAAGARDDGPDGVGATTGVDVTSAEPQPASTSAIANTAANRTGSGRGVVDPHASSRRITG